MGRVGSYLLLTSSLPPPSSYFRLARQPQRVGTNLHHSHILALPLVPFSRSSQRHMTRREQRCGATSVFALFCFPKGGRRKEGHQRPTKFRLPARCDLELTLDKIESMKRTELQSAAAQRFGKDASRWIGPATNAELRTAVRSGEPPARVATGNRNGGDLAAMIAASVAPLLAGQLNEQRVNEIVDEKLSSYHGTVDEECVRAIVAEALKAHPPVKVMLPTGTEIDATHQHKHFADLATLVGRKRHVWLVGSAGTGKSEAALNLATQMGVRRLSSPCTKMSRRHGSSGIAHQSTANG